MYTAFRSLVSQNEDKKVDGKDMCLLLRSFLLFAFVLGKKSRHVQNVYVLCKVDTFILKKWFWIVLAKTLHLLKTLKAMLEIKITKNATKRMVSS